MWNAELWLLLGTALTIAFLHTLSGPDHYLPFVALGRARRWSLGRMLLWTVVCGCGHVWSSVLIGGIGALLGWSAGTMLGWEGLRGGLAGWALLLFGSGYAAWQLLKPAKAHRHFEEDEQGLPLVYRHRHGASSIRSGRRRLTPFLLFAIFVLGPSEPMIPLLFAPALKSSWLAIALLIALYTLATLAAMAIMVALAHLGLARLRGKNWEAYAGLLSGLSIAACGGAMVFLGW